MSDLATSHDDGTFEPDEETLISALRNQDDIPILMDIVEEAVAAPYASSNSQEAHLQHSFDAKEASTDAPVSPPPLSDQQSRPKEEVKKPTTSSSTLSVSPEQLNRAIVEALEKRLPDLMTALVTEVVQNLQASSSNNTVIVTEPSSSS